MNWLLWVCLVFLLVSPNAFSKNDATSGAISIYIENDTRKIGGPGSDQSYSNGFKFSYLSAEDHVPDWANRFLNTSAELRRQLSQSKTNFGVSLGHQIYTPNNTTDPNLNLDDRPYAGWLNVGVSANFKTEARSQLFELSLGVVGPESMAEKVQNEFHRLIETELTNGWSHQLKTEPTLQLSYQQRLRFFELHQNGRKYFDVNPYFGGSLGNVSTAAHVGGVLRFGLNLPEDFGPTRPSGADGDSFVAPGSASSEVADHQISFYGFAGVRGVGVLRNIFLDGNTFQSSHRVKKYPFVGETEFGFGTQVHTWSLIWRFVTRSPEFEERSRLNSFASISLTYSNPNW
jgi:lipid A 3-O-deacylase